MRVKTYGKGSFNRNYFTHCWEHFWNHQQNVCNGRRRMKRKREEQKKKWNLIWNSFQATILNKTKNELKKNFKQLTSSPCLLYLNPILDFSLRRKQHILSRFRLVVKEIFSFTIWTISPHGSLSLHLWCACLLVVDVVHSVEWLSTLVIWARIFFLQPYQFRISHILPALLARSYLLPFVGWTGRTGRRQQRQRDHH